MYLFERDFCEAGMGRDYIPHIKSILPVFVAGEDRVVDGDVHRPDLFSLLGAARPDYRWLIAGEEYARLSIRRVTKKEAFMTHYPLRRFASCPPSSFAPHWLSLALTRHSLRLLIAGPVYSGSSFHIDPNATNAWNLPVANAKLWIFYPPGYPPPGVMAVGGGDEVIMPVSLGEWVLCFWDEHKKRMSEGGPGKPRECR